MSIYDSIYIKLKITERGVCWRGESGYTKKGAFSDNGNVLYLDNFTTYKLKNHWTTLFIIFK